MSFYDEWRERKAVAAHRRRRVFVVGGSARIAIGRWLRRTATRCPFFARFRASTARSGISPGSTTADLRPRGRRSTRFVNVEGGIGAP